MMGALGFIAEVQVNRKERPRYGNYLYGAFGRDFATLDGRRVMVVALTKRQWEALEAATGLGDRFRRLAELRGADLGQEGERFRAREMIAALLEPWIASRTLDELRPLFARHGVCWGPYQTFTELVDNDPRCSPANPLFAEVEQPGIGTYLMPGSPLDFRAAERPPPQRAPLLGQHTDEILSTLLGLTEAEIGRLHDAGVVGGPRGGVAT
jgi:2-methylfumaryl-CoA isomerase